MTISFISGSASGQAPEPPGKPVARCQEERRQDQHNTDVFELARQGLDRMKDPWVPDAPGGWEKMKLLADVGRSYCEKIAAQSPEKSTGLLLQIALNYSDDTTIGARIAAYQSVLASIGTIPHVPLVISIKSVVDSLFKNTSNSRLFVEAATPFMEELEKHSEGQNSKALLQISNRLQPPYYYDTKAALYREALKEQKDHAWASQDTFLAERALGLSQEQEKPEVRGELMKVILGEIQKTSQDSLNRDIAGTALRISDKYDSGKLNNGYEEALRAIAYPDASEKTFLHMAENILRSTGTSREKALCAKPFMEKLAKHTTDATTQKLLNVALLIPEDSFPSPVYQSLLEIIRTAPAPSEEKALRTVVEYVEKSSLDHQQKLDCIAPCMKEMEQYLTSPRSKALMKLGNELKAPYYYATKLALYREAIDAQEKPGKPIDDSFLVITALDMLKKQDLPEVRSDLMQFFLGEIAATAPEGVNKQIASAAVKIPDTNKEGTYNAGYETALNAIASPDLLDKGIPHIIEAIFNNAGDMKAGAVCAKPFIDELEKEVTEPVVKVLLKIAGKQDTDHFHLKTVACSHAALKELAAPSQGAPDLLLAQAGIDALTCSDDARGKSDLMQGILNEIALLSTDALKQQIAGAAAGIPDEYRSGEYNIGYEAALGEILSQQPFPPDKTFLHIVEDILKNADNSQEQATCIKPFMEELEHHISDPAAKMLIQTGNNLKSPYYYYTQLSCYQAALRELRHPLQNHLHPDLYLADTAVKAYRKCSEPEIQGDVAKAFVTRLAEVAENTYIREICTGACSRTTSRDTKEYEAALATIESYLQSRHELGETAEHLGDEPAEEIIIMDDQVNIGGVMLERRQ